MAPRHVHAWQKASNLQRRLWKCCRSNCHGKVRVVCTDKSCGEGYCPAHSLRRARELFTFSSRD